MGNKDLFFVFEKVIKSDLLLSKEMIRRSLDTSTKETYTGAHSRIKFPETTTLLQTGHGRETFKAKFVWYAF